MKRALLPFPTSCRPCASQPSSEALGRLQGESFPAREFETEPPLSNGNLSSKGRGPLHFQRSAGHLRATKMVLHAGNWSSYPNRCLDFVMAANKHKCRMVVVGELCLSSQRYLGVLPPLLPLRGPHPRIRTLPRNLLYDAQTTYTLFCTL